MKHLKSVCRAIALSSIFFSLGASAQTLLLTKMRPSSRLMSEGMTLADAQEDCKDDVNGQAQCLASTHIQMSNGQTSDSLAKIIADMQKDDLARSPIQAGDEGDRDALRHLPDVSVPATQAANRFSQALLARYNTIDSGLLQGEGEHKLNSQLLGYVLNRRVLLADYDTARLPFTNDSGFFNMLSYVSRQTRFETVDDYEAYAARLSELPRFFDQHKVNLRRGITTGYTASEEILPGIIDMTKSYASGRAEDHAYYKPFTSFPDTIDTSDQERLSTLGQETITKSVLPAYANLLAFFENEYAPHARKQVGIGTNARNRAYYKALVKYFTTLDITPDEVHEKGLSEVKRIRAEMDELIAKTGFEGSFKEFLDFLRTDKQFYVDTPDDLLKEAAWIAKRIDGQMPKYFGRLPRNSYGVMAVPAEIAPNYTTGRYWGGNLDNGLAGNYVVNTYDLSQRPLYNLPSLTLHEGVPGHHHQISIAQEMKDVPSFRQNLYPNAFGEGWGLYAEKLGVEMGIYRTDYENFGRLTYEMWRACRLVVDTGMHWKGWSRAQAEQCFFENSALAPHNIRTEVERYISWPGQALSYKIGELKILELRHRAETALGSDFDIRGFHDAVLENGGIPLNILEERIEAWIAKTKLGL
ncbi:MAG: DUF885 domain-containing protein [Robiginitomaculum sp.]|nr:MAG: DUF885 domain-containing protein [Robiginitomaculum sp.]